jgi:hypothetical protein
MRIYAEDRQLPPLPPAPSGSLTGRHFDQQAIERAAVILKIAAHHSRDELNAALAAARRAFLYSLEEAGTDTDAGQAVFEALDASRRNFAISRLTHESTSLVNTSPTRDWRCTV